MRYLWVYLWNGLLTLLSQFWSTESRWAYIPLEPAYPKERLNYMINDSKMPVLITKSSFLDIVPDSNVTVVNMDLDWERISKESKEIQTATLITIIWFT